MARLPDPADPRISSAGLAAGTLTDYLELTKPRVTTLVVATTAFGFFLGSRGTVNPLLLANTLIGTTLVASGTSALNMWLERDRDARMERTRRRPLPEGRLRPAQALAFGAGVAAAGILSLALTVNLLTALLATATLVSYIFLYTPMKPLSPLATLVGALPGALPPLGGWTAAAGGVEGGGWALFTILFLWQLPHSLAIAWMYRDDYERGGFRLLPVVDPEGGITARQILANALFLIPASLAPTLMGVTGPAYVAGALLLGGFLIAPCLKLARTRARADARRILLASIIYLPALLFLMVLTRV